MNSNLKLPVVCFSLFFIGCATNPIEENPVLENLAAMDVPEWDQLRVDRIDHLAGTEVYFERTEFQSDGSYTATNSEGCTWVARMDPAAPPASWSNCGSGQYGSGENRDMVQEGQLWPLEVGNSASFTYSLFDTNGIDQGKRTRKCTVEDPVNIEVASGTLDTHKVRCVRRRGDWSETMLYYFHPDYPAEVKYIRTTSSEGVMRNLETLLK